MDLLSEEHRHLSVESTPHTSYLLSNCLSSETLLPFTFLRLTGVSPFVYQTLRVLSILLYFAKSKPLGLLPLPYPSPHPLGCIIPLPHPLPSKPPTGLQALIATFITQGINTTKHLLSLHHVIEATKYFQGCGCPQVSEPQRLTA
ncbi:unnamed protein product [Rangifer tarandus platyrhynchus]|uniref:Uncharacterized protein n=2 Tax=Rangifer tarandus platyrhynchus TaxID=3082113 RepID=A0ABN8YAX2_RANTA|nr:unnamed protein product [Rangifer tarandus platyrhynchus]